jgi:Zn ribbon nucleic-acid-binding protein
MEIIVKCPVCDSDDHCFEDTMEENDFKSYMCFRCGYTSNSHYTKESKERAKHIKNTPELIRSLEVFDTERELFWYPSVLNMGPKGIIFPEGKEDNWVWRYAKVVEIDKESQKEYPVPGKDGEFYESRLDTEGAEIYNKFDFLGAVKSMGITVDLETQ